MGRRCRTEQWWQRGDRGSGQQCGREGLGRVTRGIRINQHD
jgi:hypothetical protein